MTFTLGSVLDQEDLGLRLVTGGPAALSRPIAGAHAIEIADPVRWLEPGWVMLTTGVRLRHHAAAQRQLVAELDEGGITALGFAEEIIFRSVPRAILEEAERRSFPVFAIPYRTPHRSIISFVNRSLLSNDFYILQRSLSIQNHLMDALGAEHPEDELVNRLASILGSTVLVYGPEGRLQASRGEAPSAAIWAEIAAREPALEEFTVGRWYVVSVPITAAGIVRHWLALATRRRSVSEQLSKPVIRAAERLLEVVATARERAAAEERAVRSELLRRLLSRPADDPTLADRMRAFGFESGVPCSLAVVAPVAGGAAALERGRALLEAQLAAARRPYLLIHSEQRLVVYVEGSGGFEDWLRRLRRDGVDLAAGVGREVHSPDAAQVSLHDAELALERLRRDDGAARVLRFEELDLAAWLIGDLGAGRIQPKVDALLAPIRESEMLYETLLAYLDAELDVTRAARALHLHPNSLRYRLARIEERLGRSLRSPATIANLYLATLADGSDAAGNGTPISGSSRPSAQRPSDTAPPRAGSDPG
jgi:PucR family transcriptional regulator, purine catabolism regulatory protein